jgi:hypothetical protein
MLQDGRSRIKKLYIDFGKILDRTINHLLLICSYVTFIEINAANDLTTGIGKRISSCDWS